MAARSKGEGNNRGNRSGIIRADEFCAVVLCGCRDHRFSGQRLRRDKEPAVLAVTLVVGYVYRVNFIQ